MRILPISKRKYATKIEIRNTYLVRIWYVLTLVRTKYVFTSLNTPFGTYLVRICFSKYVLRILIAYFRFFIAYFSLGYLFASSPSPRACLGVGQQTTNLKKNFKTHARTGGSRRKRAKKDINKNKNEGRCARRRPSGPPLTRPTAGTTTSL